MKLNWFRRIGIVFVPVSVTGGLISGAGIIYTVYSFIDIDSRSHSVSDTLINFVFRIVIIYALYSLIGYLTSKTEGN